MSSDVAIKVEAVSKCYQIYEQPRDRLKQFILPRFRTALGKEYKRYFREFWALRDISFEVKKGETVGVIGRNGSGKSTLLQIICGTLSPTQGDVRTQGRIGALLELGSGFNPDFTGRENVYMNAAVLGLTRQEIDERFDEIVRFADIGSFIDQPVKVYSSGMMVRLAFAVQAQVAPDILIVDEALAVGDAKFQAKCFERLKQLKEDGTSILLVTHSSDQIVTHCESAILLDQGAVVESGEPLKVVNRYMDLLFGHTSKNVASDLQYNSGAKPYAPEECDLNSDADLFNTRPGYNPYEYRWGDGAARILDYFLSTGSGPHPSGISIGEAVRLDVSIRFNEDLLRPIVGFTIKTKEGVTVFGANSETLSFDTLKSMGRNGTTVRLQFSFICRLAPGDYFISLGVATKNGEEVVPHDRRYDSIHVHVMPTNRFFGLVDLDLEFKIEGMAG